ncbi:MAG: orc1/cdc6 family replication initiation protein [Candidatus Altiarchaeota archaeon]
MIKSLFEEELADRAIFKDLKVLSPHYIPDNLPHRKQESKQIIRILAPILRNEKPNNVFIYGKTGTGKTSVVRHVIRELESIVADPARNKNNSKVASVYMNCGLGYKSKYQVLIKILEDEKLNAEGLKDAPLSDRGNKGRLMGQTPAELYERLKKLVEANSLSLILVLDEIDLIRQVDSLLYLLTRINDDIKAGNVSTIGISNKYTFKDYLDSRSKSTLCEEELVFRPYNANQLKTILAHRVKLGFRSGSISKSNIALIGAYGAQTNGDARYALKLLQKAGEIAQNAGRKRIRTDDVKDAKVKVEEDIIYELISTLPDHQQIVLYTIAETVVRGGQYKRLSNTPNDILSSGEVYESYEKICKQMEVKCRTMRWFREYLNELEMLGLITLTISGKGIRGNTTLIRLGSQPEEVKSIVAQSLGF